MDTPASRIENLHLRTLALAALALALVYLPGRAQSAGTGMLDGVPFVLSVADGELPAPVATGSDELAKPPGVYSTHPGKATLGMKYGYLGADEFSLFLDPNTQLQPMSGPAPDIDGLSIGLDWISVLPNGELWNDPAPGFWAAIVFSVTKATVGLNTNSGVILRETSGPGGKASGDLFSYLWPGSQVPPAERRNEAVLTNDSTEIDLHGGAPPVPVEMDAVDIFLSLYDLIGWVPGFDLPAPTVYFSVSDATKTRIPSAWVGGSGNAQLKSGATIFAMTIVEVPVGSGIWMWTPPWVAYTPTGLGLSNGEDVDALSLDLLRQTMLISTDHTVPGVVRRDPILFLDLAADAPTPVPLTVTSTPTTVRVSQRVDLGRGPLPDDVNSICAIDPRGTLRAGVHPELLAFALGSPNPALTLQGSSQIRMNAFHAEGPAIHLLVRELPPGSFAGVLMSAFPSFVPLGPQTAVLNPNLFLFPWSPLVAAFQQQRVNYPPLPFLQGVPIYLQTVGLEPTGNLFSTYILDILL